MLGYSSRICYMGADGDNWFQEIIGIDVCDNEGVYKVVFKALINKDSEIICSPVKGGKDLYIAEFDVIKDKTSQLEDILYRIVFLPLLDFTETLDLYNKLMSFVQGNHTLSVLNTLLKVRVGNELRVRVGNELRVSGVHFGVGEWIRRRNGYVCNQLMKYIDRNSGVGILLRYRDDDDGVFELLVGLEYCYIYLFNGFGEFYLDVLNARMFELKTGKFIEMFVQLGLVGSIEEFIQVTSSLCWLSLEEGRDEVFAEALYDMCGKINYQTPLQVLAVSIHFDEGEYYILESNRKVSYNLRREYLSCMAVVIQKIFRGWLARKKWAWNPENRLGRYYLKKAFDEIKNEI